MMNVERLISNTVHYIIVSTLLYVYMMNVARFVFKNAKLMKPNYINILASDSEWIKDALIQLLRYKINKFFLIKMQYGLE